MIPLTVIQIITLTLALLAFLSCLGAKCTSEKIIYGILSVCMIILAIITTSVGSCIPL